MMSMRPVQAFTTIILADAQSEGRQNGNGNNRPQNGEQMRSRTGEPKLQGRNTHAFKDANKAAIGNHHRKDRALRKMGGPAN